MLTQRSQTNYFNSESQFDYCLDLLLCVTTVTNRAAHIITGIYDYNVSASDLDKSLGCVNFRKKDVFILLL